MAKENAEVIFTEQGIQCESEGKYYVNFWALKYQPRDYDREIYPLEDGRGKVVGNIYEDKEQGVG